MGFNIAIDGPAGAGKSTVARKAAEKLGFLYVDTGAMYRTIAIYMLKEKTDIDDENALRDALEKISIKIRYLDGIQHMILNGEDVTGLIRTEEVSAMTSKVSARQIVRDKLTDLQLDLARKNDVIMDGRDIGTMILPDADLKIFLTASADARARRRYLELKEKGKGDDLSLDSIRSEIEERDYRDSHRESAPLKKAKDAVLLDTSDMDVDAAVKAVTDLARERL